MQEENTIRKWKIVRTIARVVAIVGFCMFVYGFSIEWNAPNFLPHSMNPTTGNIIPLNIHGVDVFQTEAQQRMLTVFLDYGFAIFVIAGFLAAFAERHYPSQKKIEPLPIKASYIIHSDLEHTKKKRNEH
jgi:hypothetical protein